MTSERVVLAGLSAAMDGGFTAVADVSKAMIAARAADDYRLIGGVTVLLQVQRLGLVLPLRATGDADFGVPPPVLRRPELVQAIEALATARPSAIGGSAIDDRRVAAVDLLVPAYRSRARDTVKVGDVVTTEAPGLAEALRRPGVTTDADLRLTDGGVLTTSVVLPDAVSTLALKASARSVRNETRDAEDLWRCLEIAAADGITPDMFQGDPPLDRLRATLWRELGPGGHSLDAVTGHRSPEQAARLRTRIRALLAEVVGTDG